LIPGINQLKIKEPDRGGLSRLFAWY